MMVKRHPNTTRNLGAPANWDPSKGDCAHLPIADIDTTAGPMMESIWEPTPAELEAIRKGGHIVLQVYGRGHPPVMLTARCP